MENQKARPLYESGLDAYRAGEYEVALEAFVRARSLFSEAGDRSAEAEVLNDMGVVYVQLEAWDQAQQALDSSLAIRQGLADRSREAMTWGNLGMLYARQGDDARAVEAYEQSIAIFRELGERGNEKAISRQLSKVKIQVYLALCAQVIKKVGAAIKGTLATEPPVPCYMRA